MRHPKIIIASITLAAAAAIGGGVTAAAATSPSASSPPAASQHAAAAVRTAQSIVGGKPETILVTSQGLPLYFHLSDTAAKSAVTGELAALWPPLTSPSPAATGLSGKLATVVATPGLARIAGLLGVDRAGPGRFVRQRLRLLRRPRPGQQACQ